MEHGGPRNQEVFRTKEAVLLFCGKCLSLSQTSTGGTKQEEEPGDGWRWAKPHGIVAQSIWYFSHDGLTTGRAKPTLDHPDKYQRRIARSTEPKEGRGGHSTDTWWLCTGQKTWKTFRPIETDPETHQIARRIQTHKSWEIRPGWEWSMLACPCSWLSWCAGVDLCSLPPRSLALRWCVFALGAALVDQL